MRLTLPRRGALPAALGGMLAVLRLLPRVSPALTLLLALGVIAATLLPLAFLVVTGLLVGSIPAAVSGGLDSDAGRHTVALLAAAAALIVGERLLGPVLGALAAVFGRRVDRHLQERVMSAVGGPSGVAHLEDPETLDLIVTAQAISTQGHRPGDAVRALASLLPSWFQALGAALILVTFRPWLGLAWVAMWPVVLYYLQREYLRVGSVARGETGALRRAAYYRDLALTGAPAKEVRIWGLPGWLQERFQTAWQQAMAPIWTARRPGRRVLWLSTATVVAADLCALALLALAALRGELTLAALAVYLQAVIEASNFRAFDDVNMTLAHAAVAVPSLLELERRLSEHPLPGTASVAPDGPGEEIRLESVRFRYVGQTVDTLAGIDLSIPAGRSLAIVGANGAGKTTLVKLLCRMYEPSGGRICVDGVDLQTCDAHGWQHRVAAIFQDFARYHLPARDNVVMGAPALAGDTEKLKKAARKAGALDLVEALPRGWDTILSRQYTGGVDLSGGQWQRIALARAMFAVEGGARLLILDEPTANLDVRAEAELYDRFLELTAGLTTILISHRFSTVRRADQIIVLEGGRIVEQGTHDELMDAGGRYATMFTLQAARFSDESADIPEGVI